MQSFALVMLFVGVAVASHDAVLNIKIADCLRYGKVTKDEYLHQCTVHPPFEDPAKTNFEKLLTCISQSAELLSMDPTTNDIFIHAKNILPFAPLSKEEEAEHLADACRHVGYAGLDLIRASVKYNLCFFTLNESLAIEICKTVVEGVKV